MAVGVLRVVKLGGSLLGLAGLETHLRDWLSRQAAARDVLIVGGGAAADAVRSAQRSHGFDDVDAHWRAIDAMSRNVRQLAPRLAEMRLVDDIDDVADLIRGRLVFDPRRFLLDVEPTRPGTRLPLGWEATSDSISARVAEVLGADELVLLKSALPDGATFLAEWSTGGYVDAHFPLAASGLHVRCVNLRERGYPERTLRP